MFGLRGTGAAVLILSCSGCASLPGPVPPPPQYVMPQGPEPGARALAPDRSILTMGDADVEEHIEADVHPANGGDWRWTGAHPRFRVNAMSGKALVFLRFRIHEDTFRDTGPVTIAVHVDGQLVGKETYRYPGQFEFRHAVAGAARVATIQVDVDPPWIAPRDHAVLGIYLNAIGFQAAP